MLKNNYSGKFIVFDGLDGSGQSTQAELLRNFLIGKKYQAVLTKEPTLDSTGGEKIRRVLDKKEKISPKELQELFAQDRKEHLENLVIPALKEGKVVISDRYFFSSFAFGSSNGLDLDWLIEINDDFLLPDLTFFLKVSPEVCVSRIIKRNKEITLFEEKQKLEKVWQIYKILPSRFENIYIIEGEKPIKEVFEQIKEIINNKL